MTAALPEILASLAERGWARHMAERPDADAVLFEIQQLVEVLGTRVVGRAGALAEVVRPQASDDAHPRSLSAQYGHDHAGIFSLGVSILDCPAR
jgi:predicted kinase